MLAWTEREAWVAVFDILGFKSLIRQADHVVPREVLKSKIEDLLQSLESDPTKHGQLDFVMFSDTFVVFAPDLDPRSYTWFLLACRSLMTKSIYVELPMRGAISLGPAFFSKEPTIVLGSSFVEAYEYCDDQDWIGLLLTPLATAALRRAGLEPLHHDFVSDVVPLRKKSSEGVLAYRFQNGSANFDSPLLPHLVQMRHFAPESEKHKYQDTIEFIQRHYRGGSVHRSPVFTRGE